MKLDPALIEQQRKVVDSLRRGRAGHSYGGVGDRFMISVGSPNAVILDQVPKGFVVAVGINEEQARDLRAAIDAWLTEQGLARGMVKS